MIGEILAYLRNYFVAKIHTGDFVISDGKISGVNILPNQYYRVVGSTYNDGVWKYPDDELTDESFAGAVWVLSIPPDLLKITAEIEKYTEKETVSPYTSESWGGYSYSKRTMNGVPISWQAAFADRLKRWKKL